MTLVRADANIERLPAAEQRQSLLVIGESSSTEIRRKRIAVLGASLCGSRAARARFGRSRP